MKVQDQAKISNESRLPEIPVKLRFFIIVFATIGLIVILGGLLGVQKQRVYQVFLVNFAFWTGMAQAAVAFAAVYRMTNAGWSSSFRRIGEMFAAFLPVSLLFLIFILLIHPQVYPWVGDSTVKNPVWLNSTFFVFRLIFYFTVATLLSMYYVSISFRPDIGLIKENGGYDKSFSAGLKGAVVQYLSRDWKGYENEYNASLKKLKILTPVFLIVYVVIYTFAGFDLLMTLDPGWYSTVFGWLFVISSFYAGVTAIMMAGYFIRTQTPSGSIIDNGQFHDIGKLMLGFCMFTGGLVFSQYLTIWYGNIPKETSYIITRFHQEPWAVLSTLVLLFAYFVPLVFLFSRKIKQTPAALFTLGVLIVSALWLNRFIEAVPSIWFGPGIPLGLAETGITLGFLSIVVLSWIWLARIVPLTVSKPDL